VDSESGQDLRADAVAAHSVPAFHRLAGTHVDRAGKGAGGRCVKSDDYARAGFFNRSHRALEQGAREVDMVINIGALKSGRDGDVGADIKAVVDAAHAGSAIVKVIFENAYLDDAEKELACRLSEEAGAAFVKTSTGFAPSGATIADLKLMRRCVGSHVQVKAAGGIRTLDALLEVMAVGVTRIGATATETMLEDFKARKAALEPAAVG